MLVILLIFALSCVPAILLYFWMKTTVRKPSDENYRKNCAEALKYGFLMVLPVMCVSCIFSIILNVTGLKNGSSITASALHDLTIAAFSEELCKTYMFHKLLKKIDYSYTWLDMIIFIVCISIGFELIESVIYIIGSSPGQMLVRGVLIMHAGYGFIEGMLYGKAKYTGNKIYAVIGFVVCWLLHGAYDFGLSPDFLALGEDTAFLSVTLAIVSFFILIWMIVFFAKKKKEKYLVPLN